MRIRTLVGILLALVAVVLVSFVVQENQQLLSQRLALGEWASVSLAWGLVTVFLLGLLPPVVVLLVQHLRQELVARRERRFSREADSRQGSFRRALDYRADGQWGKAAEELESVLAEKPEDFAALLHYGEVLRAQGQGAEALDVHRRASVLYPQSVALLYELAEDYSSIGDDEVGHEIRNRIVRDFSGVGLEVERRRRNRAMAEGDWAEAARLQEAIDATLLENDDREELRREAGVRMGLAYQRALVWLGDGRVSEAKTVFRDLLTEEPRFIPASIMLGEAYLLEGSADAALGEWRRGYEDTGSPIFLQRIEDHFIERAQPARAIETLHGLIANAENDLLPRFYLGRLYYRLEMLADAERALSAIGDRVGSSPTYHLLLARIHQRRGESARSVEAYMVATREAGLTSKEYVCEVCRARRAEWHARCTSCGSWNSFDLDFEEERLSAAELGVRARPVWTPVESTGDEDPETA